MNDGEIRRLSIDDLERCVDVATDRGWATPRAHWSMLLRFAIAYGFDDGVDLGGTVVAFPYERVTFNRNDARAGTALGARNWASAARESARVCAARRSANGDVVGRPLYEKLGFVAQEDVHIHEGRWIGNVDRLEMKHSSQLSDADREAIVAADARALRGGRSRLIDGSLETTSKVAIARDSSGVSYAMSANNTPETEIGPVIAANDDIALRLVGTLASTSQVPVRIRVADRHTALRERLEAHGLKSVRSLPYMTRGQVDPPSDEWYAIALSSTG